VILKSTRKKRVESLYDLLSGTPNGILAIHLRILLNDSRKQDNVPSSRLFNDEPDVEEHFVTLDLRNGTPKARTGPHW
jgi:hypothetical protein